MSVWSASLLLPAFPRSLIGFDYRVGPASPNALGSAATLDNQVWPRLHVEEINSDENGLNLYDGPLQEMLKIRPSDNSVLVAFDLPDQLIQTFAATFGIVPISTGALDANWTLLGYDVVDPRTQSSGLYSFDWSQEERTGICRTLSISLNSYGLVAQEDAAIRAAIRFDQLVREHAPFAPCGVWVRQ